MPCEQILGKNNQFPSIRAYIVQQEEPKNHEKKVIKLENLNRG